MQCAMHLVFVLLGVAFIAAPASAETFPLTGVSTTSRYELLDQVKLTALSATAAFDASKGYLRYSMLSVPSGAGIVTTVTDVTSLKRYTFSGTWSSTCAVAAPPAAGSDDIKYAVAALVASGAAASQRGVSSALVYANTSSLRNIASKRWIATAATLTVNTTSCTVNLQWDFTNQWILNPTQSTSAQQLIGFSVNGSCAGSPIVLSGNVVWVSQATPNALLFQPLGTCNATMPSAAAPSTVVTTPAPTTASTNAFPLPTLPNVFSALIQATFAERATTFSVYESNSGSYARATFLWPTTAKTVVVDGTSALAYLQTSTTTGLSSAWADPMAADGTFATRQFFSSADTCSKTVFTYSLLNSVSDLLAKSASLNPRYMGQILVRGISTQYWRVVSGTQTYTWYFASTSWQFPSNATSSYRQLVRVTASGSGLSPFFVAHPYLQRWLPQPQSTIPFCANVMDIAPDECTDSQRNFVHIYDFMSFVPRVDASEVAVPSSCTSDTGSVVTSTTDCPATMSGGSIFLLFFFSALFGGLLGAGAMYCRLKRKFKSADAAHEDDD